MHNEVKDTLHALVKHVAAAGIHRFRGGAERTGITNSTQTTTHGQRQSESSHKRGNAGTLPRQCDGERLAVVLQVRHDVADEPALQEPHELAHENGGQQHGCGG